MQFRKKNIEKGVEQILKDIKWNCLEFCNIINQFFAMSWALRKDCQMMLRRTELVNVRTRAKQFYKYQIV